MKKEGFDLEKVGRPCSPTIVFTAYESPEICEAMQVVCSASYSISMVSSRFNDRKARLSLELAENSAPMPGPGEEKAKEDNPALKEAASQFNDALLDEQAKEIENLRDKCKKYADILDSAEGKIRELKAENRRIKDSDLNLEGLTYATRELKEKDKKIAALTNENERLKDQIAVLDACKKHNDKIDRLQIKRLGKEIARLNGIIHDKNEEIKRKTKGCCELVTENVGLKKKLSDKDAVLSDVAEELRLSKIREKNLTEVCQKYMNENEELKKELAGKVVDKIDAQALKSAESALAYKDSYIEKLKNKKVINNRVSMEAIAKYVDAVSKAELDGLVLVSWKNDGKEITSVYQLKNGKRYTLSLVYTGEEFLFYKTDLDKKRHISTPEISQEELMKIQEKVAASFDIAEEGGDHSAIIARCFKNIAISKDEAEIIERCTKNGTELHYSEKDGFTYTNVFGDEMPIICLRGMCQVFTDEEIKNMRK